MRRQRSLGRVRNMRQQNTQKDIKNLPQRNLRTSTKTRQRYAGSAQAGPSWDLDSVSSDGSVKSDGSPKGNQALTLVPSDTAGLTDVRERVCKTKRNQALRSRGKVLLSHSEEAEILPWELKPGQTPVTPAGKVSGDAEGGDTGESRHPYEDISGQSCAGVDSQLDDSLSEDTVISGPSSPQNTIISLRCRKCESLFNRMRRQGPLKPTKRNNDPASLSCDNWILNKAWHPQRQRQVKGRLWEHLKQIRKLAAEHSDCAVAHTAQHCSRLHVFLQRNLRRCMERSATLRGACKSHSVVRPHRTRHVRSSWPGLGDRLHRQASQRSLVRSNTVQPLGVLDLTVDGSTKERGANPSRVLSQEGRSLEKRGVGPDATGVLGKLGDSCSLEGTRRVLKFKGTPSLLTMETQEPTLELRQENNVGRGSCGGPVDPMMKDWDAHRGLQKDLPEDSNRFRTPLERSCIEPTVVKSSRISQNCSFKSMLAAFEKSHNRIIKENN